MSRVGRFALPLLGSGGTTVNDIIFYSNPSTYSATQSPGTYQWIVDTNSDSVGVGSGTTGSLRYCMTNALSGDIIVFSDTLTDDASTGDINTVKITSTLPNTTCIIYGNNKNITVASGSTFDLTSTGSIKWYSINFCSFINYTKSIGVGASYIEMYGCRLYRINTSATYLLYAANVKLYNCIVEECYYHALTSGNGSSYNEFTKCIIRKNVASYIISQFKSQIYDSFISSNTASISIALGNSESGFICKRSIIHSSNLAYYAYGTVSDNIFINCSASTTNSVASQTYDFYNNTIISVYALSRVINLGSATGIMNCYNNLFICPRSTYIVEGSSATINESGNIYVVLNDNGKLPTSTRITTNIEELIDELTVKNIIDGVERDYVNPNGTAIDFCTTQTGYNVDFNGNTRSGTCDCGAVEKQ